uniref:Large ribosomal subunit protein uL10m n=3 Tax=Delphinidae TaxID=9726 RepID=A0A2U3UZH2_TURTR|nr:39S ribosomal protein L10, mitochondrial [Tursiops truncatus]
MVARADGKSGWRSLASLLGDWTPDGSSGRAGSPVPGSAHSCCCSSRQLRPPLPALGLPTILSSFRLARLRAILPVAMAAAVAGMLRGGLLPQAGQLPIRQLVRYGSKAVTRHRRVMHFERQKLMAVTEYIPPKPAVNPRCLPPPPRPPQEETGLVRLLRREIAAVFRDNRMIAVCQNVALSAEDKLLMRHRLRRHKILMKVFPNQILKSFLEDSKYPNLLPLFVGHNLLLVSEEPKVKEMVRILKSVPFLPLLGGCVDDIILSRQGFINYSKLPSLALVQGELVGGLTLLTAQTHSLLQHQPLRLTALLDQYVRQQHEEDPVVPASGQPDPPDAVPDS